MNWFQRNKKAIVIIGLILLVAVVVLFVVMRSKAKRGYGIENPVNKNPVSYNKDDFFRSVLSQLGVPVSDTNLTALKEWQRHEGGSAAFNPLNTTKIMNKGETDFNSAHVKNYPDFATGVDATVKTLKLSYYKAIVSALAQELPSWKSNQPIIAALTTWGTVNYANALA